MTNLFDKRQCPLLDTKNEALALYLERQHPQACLEVQILSPCMYGKEWSGRSGFTASQKKGKAHALYLTGTKHKALALCPNTG